MDCSTPGFAVPHHPLESGQVHVQKLVMPSNQHILCYPLLFLPSIFPSIRVFSNDSLFTSGDQSIGTSASASVLWMNIQGWFPLRLTGLVCLQSKGLSRVHSSTTVPKYWNSKELKFQSSSSLALWLCGPAFTTIHDYWKGYSLDYTDFFSKVMPLLFNMLSRFVIGFLSVCTDRLRYGMSESKFGKNKA